MQKLKIHENRSYLMYEDGTPFFYLGDTAWDLFHSLSREEAEYYFSVRAGQGYTVIQCVLLGGASLDIDVCNKYGRRCLKEPKNELIFDTDGADSYWNFVAWCLECGKKYGLYFAMVPMWHYRYLYLNDTIFTGYEPSYKYGKFLGERYREYENIIWMLGGDVEVEEFKLPIFQGLADGIRDGEGDMEHRRLMTFHPRGQSSSVGQLGGDKAYLDFHSSQSGHAVTSYHPHRWFDEMRNIGKPFLDTESQYEDHVVHWRPFLSRYDETDIRRNAYECILAGACGHTYGNPIICFFTYELSKPYECIYTGDLTGTGWMDALTHPGGVQMQYVKKLRLSRPYFDFRPAQEMVLNSDDDLQFGRISAGRGDKYAFIYTPYGREIQVDCSHLGGEFIRASWFNPRTGEETVICDISPRKAIFVPETRGKGQDWVLILESDRHEWKLEEQEWEKAGKE